MNHDDAEIALQKRLDLIRAARGNAVPLEDVAEVVRAILDTMSGEISAKDLHVYNELEALARIIRETKQEIAEIRPEEIKDEFLPTAADELDAIVQSTETAANAILDAVESIEAVIPAVDAAAGEALSNATMAIYEGCNFQDLTGQRISKVVNTLKRIEERVNTLISAFGPDLEAVAEGLAGEAAAAVAGADADAALLNGPQHPETASSQDEIDRLLASLG
ncbi:Chemotaxis protein [uncultured Alphaproteobacteria bacterium]|uniref:Chemotaxis protein n=1 Tax=uncultured Alphaproteobacteria bacterium TaxID=91750 RepID=A0A212JPA1_9PROT|nr:Chemotaxis protein [uncultured Alphaproteobacteria bacterium]